MSLQNDRTCQEHFNPRSREGSDLDGRFQESMMSYFNPRSREGSDSQNCEYRNYCLISIHAPAKGATPPYKPEAQNLLISIHAPAKGATFFPD